MVNSIWSINRPKQSLQDKRLKGVEWKGKKIKGSTHCTYPLSDDTSIEAADTVSVMISPNKSPDMELAMATRITLHSLDSVLAVSVPPLF